MYKCCIEFKQPMSSGPFLRIYQKQNTVYCKPITSHNSVVEYQQKICSQRFHSSQSVQQFTCYDGTYTASQSGNENDYFKSIILFMYWSEVINFLFSCKCIYIIIFYLKISYLYSETGSTMTEFRGDKYENMQLNCNLHPFFEVCP